ncbi:DUF2975 domain-containing protein [Agrococcus baldri]|uniref:DUF2975 domain-containing protein n=1 Tax=Agrococcus baldri TaxID=153730 RepID=A0AA87REG0_9MICO|nr:DUF2975 domain-containing protein [Agrococcus baldri]GEK81575.1 hypothetical protein ABA31_29260 [Agrococcus baldri]
MQRAAILGAKAVIVVALLLSLLGQLLIVPLLAAEAVREMPAAEGLRWPGIIGCWAIILCVQVALVCMWRLLSMVARDRIFDVRAFRLVDVMTACAIAAAVLFAVAAVILTGAQALPPVVGLFLIMGFFGAAGIALLLLVMRGLLARATGLEADMAEVV